MSNIEASPTSVASFRPVAWQVGRHGEVAGGMTQVVNGYLGWQFSKFEVGVITSRDGSKGLRSVILFLRALGTIFKLRDAKKNVFVVHLSQGGSFVREGLLLLLARARGFGTVAHMHGSSFVDFASRRPWLVEKVLSAATKVVVLSRATQDAVCRFVPAMRVELIPNAVPEGLPKEKERLVVFGGGVSNRKGVDVLVEAWRRVGVGRGWKLVIAGPVIDREVVPESLDDAEFVGSIENRSLMQLLDRSSIAVLPSRDEAMPMFILEAMGRNNCVISTRVGGIPAVLADGRGLLVDAGDPAQLASTLSKAMADDAYREATARVGRAAFDQGFSARTIYPRVEHLWWDVLNTPLPATDH